MKTFNLNLEPVVYQYRFETINKSFDGHARPQTPHLRELRKSSKDRKFDPEMFKKVLYTKLGIILACAALFTVLSLVF